MRTFGYEVRPDDWLDRDDDDEDERSLRLSEVTLLCNAEDLRRLHRFISEVLAEATEKGWLDLESWHEHFRDRDPDWTKEEGDLILYFQRTPESPA